MGSALLLDGGGFHHVALLARLLAKQPEDRYQSAQEVLDALAQLPG